MNDTTNFDAKAIIDSYREQYYKAPVLGKWEAPRYGNYTPKQLERQKAKAEASYKKDFDKATERYDSFMKCCENITTLKAENLRDFFVKTIRNNVEEAKSMREKVSAAMRDFEKKYNREVAVTIPDANDYRIIEINPFKMAAELFMYNFSSPREYRKMTINMVELNEVDSNNYYRRLLNTFCPTHESKMEFAEDYLNYRKSGEYLYDSSKYPSTIFVELVERISNIIDDITKVLGGEPVNCSFDANWGVDGHFNGIVVGSNGKKASFKSFFAGGWNIQKLHIRFKVTLLKG